MKKSGSKYALLCALLLLAVAATPLALSQAASPAKDVRRAVIAQPVSLLNMPAEKVLAAFAAPELKREEGMVKVWQYRTEECVLDIYFLGNAVSYYEVRDRKKAVSSGPDAEGQRPCLRGISES